MPTLTVTPEGQVTLGEEVLRSIGLHAGDQVECEVVAENSIRLRPVEVDPVKRTGTIDDLYGFLKGKGNGKIATIEEMNEAIADGWAGVRR